MISTNLTYEERNYVEHHVKSILHSFSHLVRYINDINIKQDISSNDLISKKHENKESINNILQSINNIKIGIEKIKAYGYFTRIINDCETINYWILKIQNSLDSIIKKYKINFDIHDKVFDDLREETLILTDVSRKMKDELSEYYDVINNT